MPVSAICTCAMKKGTSSALTRTASIMWSAWSRCRSPEFPKLFHVEQFGFRLLALGFRLPTFHAADWPNAGSRKPVSSFIIRASACLPGVESKHNDQVFADAHCGQKDRFGRNFSLRFGDDGHYARSGNLR